MLLVKFEEMSILALVSVADYLGHVTDPDCDYVDGRLVERNVGEISHGDAQGRTYAFILANARDFWTGVEVRVQVRADRFRVPDVVVVRGGRPAGRVITSLPEVAVEVLSPEDRAADVQDKIDDYLRFGVPAVWLIDPERQRAWIHTGEGSREALDRILRNAAGDLEVPLSAVFPNSA
jgi:Uma2 family endonuclease